MNKFSAILGLAVVLVAGVIVSKAQDTGTNLVPVVVYVSPAAAAEMQSMLSNGVNPGDQIENARRYSIEGQKYWLGVAIANAPRTNVLAVDYSISNYVTTTYSVPEQRFMAINMLNDKIGRIPDYKGILKFKATLKRAGITSTNAVALPEDQR